MVIRKNSVTSRDSRGAESVSVRFSNIAFTSLAVAACFLSICARTADAQGGQYAPQQYQQVPGPPQGVPPNFQGYPPQGQGNPQQTNFAANLQSANADTGRAQAISQWFQRYDQVRRNAQMNPQERQKADSMMGNMSNALNMFLPGEEKVAASKLLSSLVNRYNTASEEMKHLPFYPETEQLHRGYFQYFTTARQLFSDYLAVQQNPLAKDASGNPLAAGLMPRKQNLEYLDQQNKVIDTQLRARFGIRAYQY